MFEIGKKYRRLSVTKKRQEEISYYECIAVGEMHSFFKTVGYDEIILNEVTVPNDVADRFDLVEGKEEQLMFLENLIKNKEDKLHYLQKRNEANLKEEIKVINELKELRTRKDGNIRTHLTWDSAVEHSFGYKEEL